MALHRLPHRLLLDADSSTTAPGNVNRTKASYGSDPNFDTNMVIILAALLCALICALGLNSMVHCALRCSRRFASETPGDAAASRLAATKGLKKSALNKIPMLVYGSGSNIAATDCAICLGEFVNGEKIRVLPTCNHGFHVRCIDTWLLAHSSCPTCRQSLLEQPTISEARAVVVAAPAPTDAGTRSHVENPSGGHEHLSVAVVVDEVV